MRKLGTSIFSDREEGRDEGCDPSPNFETFNEHDIREFLKPHKNSNANMQEEAGESSPDGS